MIALCENKKCQRPIEWLGYIIKNSRGKQIKVCEVCYYHSKNQTQAPRGLTGMSLTH